MRNKFSWKIAGEAGDGILNAGLMFARMCMKGGLNVFASAEYPSLIRGGHNHLDVMADEDMLFSHTKYIDVLVALNRESLEKHAGRVSQNGGIIYDGDKLQIDMNEIRDDVRLFPMPLLRIAEQNGGKIMRNVVAMGATVALVDYDIELFNQVIRDNFGAKKGEAIANANIGAAKAGYDYVKQNFKFDYKLQKRKPKNAVFMSGNEAIVAGALKAGCKFLAAYPMTPATSVMTNMAAQEKNYNVVVKHTEDEIAAINMAIGASYAGVRAMTCTSGGGFCLMVEGLGLASQMEIPLVIVEAQRPGPATGMATHSGQGDLRFVMHASTDESPRAIIAPGDQEECFYRTVDAFNIAEKYQMPVIILTDKYLGESYKSIPVFDESARIDRGKLLTQEYLDGAGDFRRYAITEDGISPRSIPSQKGGEHTASSYEHDEEGYEREEEETRVAMHNKRFRKFESLKNELPPPQFFGDKDAGTTIISWGSTKGPILQAMRKLSQKGMKTNFCQIVYISPFPKEDIAKVIRNSRRTVVIEGNKTSQLSGIIKEHTGLDVDYKILKYDGRPFFSEEIVHGIKEIVENNNTRELVFSKNTIVERC
ncbi:MAG: 2-oxoacid:acceptor oxidoreductase subunit alpha [Candidatus Aenigmarchaeota archaeon]|nr:2-oxoacid:acceptor oxidoreductase subunit alpha [Candidatus Aenigmarchaeota archaeon]